MSVFGMILVALGLVAASIGPFMILTSGDGNPIALLSCLGIGIALILGAGYVNGATPKDFITEITPHKVDAGKSTQHNAPKETHDYKEKIVKKNGDVVYKY